MSDKEMARECGYIGKASGRVNLPQFKKALAKAREPILVRSAVTVVLREGEERLGPMDLFASKYPRLAHLVPSDQSPCITITAYASDRDTANKSSGICGSIEFVIMSTGQSECFLISNPAVLEEFRVALCYPLWEPKKNSYLAITKAFAGYENGVLGPHSSPIFRLALPALAGALFSSHIPQPNDIKKALSDTSYLPAVELFLPKGEGKAIASYRPCYDDIWEHENGDMFIEKNLLKRLSKCQKIVSAEYSQSFCDSDRVIKITGWEDIVNRLGEYYDISGGWINGLECTDKLSWHLVLDPQLLPPDSP
ncbi:MAG: hypothetical protein NTV57_15735 [Cyanobacteria bacterium]|nr:hypothetical protein [Cyanobacteriota bacterium]